MSRSFLPLPPNQPKNHEIFWEPAIVTSLQDETKQFRVKIQTATTALGQVTDAPFAKALVNNSQVTSKSGSTMVSPHNLKRGDLVMVQRPTSSGQDWFIAGHPGTITDQQQGFGAAGGSTGAQQFAWESHLGNGTRTGKAPRISTKYPGDKQATYLNPQPATMQIDQESKHVREYAKKKIGEFNQLGQKTAQQWGQGQNITENLNTGSQITKMIMPLQSHINEAQQNNTVVQALDKLRTQTNTSDMGGFPGQANTSQIKNISSLLGGNLFGQFQGLIGQFQALANKQNQAADQNKMLPASVNDQTFKIPNSNTDLIPVTTDTTVTT